MLLLSITLLQAQKQTPENLITDYPVMVKVEGGSFTMGDTFGGGDDNEKPTHKVTLTTFYMSTTEVTVKQYKRFCDEMGVSMPEAPEWGWEDNAPIVNVSWNRAMLYCEWLFEVTDKKYTLPTEAQWEYAARGGKHSKGTKFSGHRSMLFAGWYIENSGGKTHPVATKKVNELGLYDMSGNVNEWCSDFSDDEYYSISPSYNPKGAATFDDYSDIGDFMVNRGGGFNSPAYSITSRGNGAVDKGYVNRGFRVVYN